MALNGHPLNGQVMGHESSCSSSSRWFR
jgi:hypothetical protein